MTRLTAETRGETDLVVTRYFSAPPDRVYRALTETALMRQWMTIEAGALKSLDGEARVGASHRFVWDNDGADMHMVASYDELRPPQAGEPALIRHREAWPEYGFMESTVETRLTADGTGTRMVMVITFPNAEARGQAIDSGMTDGMEETYANLDLLLARG